MRELLAVDDYLGKHSYYLAGVQLRWKPCSFLQNNVKCKNFCWRLEVFATLQCTEFLLSSYCVGRAFHIHIIIVLFTNCVHHDLFYIILI